MSAINTVGTTANSTDTTANPNSSLTQADFLQLLVTQMTSQDPLNPESDTDFAAQLAQFSNLQESTSIAGNTGALQASSLIGMDVDISTNGATTSGLVSGVDISTGTPQVMVNGQLYGLSQITSITPPSTAGTASTAASAPAVTVKP